MKYLIENCAGSALSALRAQEGGAQRVELCAALSEGGLSPSYGEVKLARRLIDIKLHVLVRPRSGDFLYSPLEEELMLEDIRQYLALGVDGFVLGALTPEGDIDCPLLERLIRATEGRPVTFHRAIDMCRAPLEALEDTIALEGAPLLRQLVEHSAGRIRIMPGGGITPENIQQVALETGAHELHLSARSPVASAMRYRNPRVSMGGGDSVDEYAQLLTDPSKIRAARLALEQLP